MKKEMNLIFTASKQYAPYLTVLLESIKQNTPNTYFNCYIVHKELGEEEYTFLSEIISEDVGEIHMIKINEQIMEMTEEAYGGYISKVYPIEACVKLLLSWIIPQEIDRILYLGIDTIVNGDLNELYDMDFEDKILIACRNIQQNGDNVSELWNHEFRNHFRRFEPDTVFNACVMLLAPKKIRDEFKIDDFKRAAIEMEYDLLLVEQDIQSWLYHSRIRWVDPYRYNFQIAEPFFEYYGEKAEYEYAKENSLIIHYVGKPWNFKVPDYGDIYKIWWEYALKTRFYKEWIMKLVSEGVVGWKEKAHFLEHRDLIMQKEDIANVISDYFNEKNYQNIGVYGAGDYGKMFLADSPKEYKYYFFDQKVTEMYGYEVKHPDCIQDYPELDVIVITPFYFKEIKKLLREKVSVPVVDYSSIINNAYQYRYDTKIERKF